MNRYYGQLMYCAFLPFSINAPDEAAALIELKKQAPESLREAEQREVLFHLTRIPKADRVFETGKESSNVTLANDARSLQKTHRILHKAGRGSSASQPSAASHGV